MMSGRPDTKRICAMSGWVYVAGQRGTDIAEGKERAIEEQYDACASATPSSMRAVTAIQGSQITQ